MKKSIEILNALIKQSDNRLATLRSQHDEIDNMPDGPTKDIQATRCSIAIEMELENNNRLKEFKGGLND